MDETYEFPVLDKDFSISQMNIIFPIPSEKVVCNCIVIFLEMCLLSWVSLDKLRKIKLDKNVSFQIQRIYTQMSNWLPKLMLSLVGVRKS